MEIWKEINGYEGYYWISNKGAVKSCARMVRNTKNSFRESPEKIISLGNPKEYQTIGLSVDGKTKTVRPHRLVAQHFIPNPENLPEVNHKDGNKLNNNVENLEWCTKHDNMIHAYRVLNRRHAMSDKHYKDLMSSKAMTVYKFDKLINVFYSVADAELVFGVSRGCIRKYCNRGHHLKCFKWTFVDKNFIQEFEAKNKSRLIEKEHSFGRITRRVKYFDFT